jgi:hypothetical protein
LGAKARNQAFLFRECSGCPTDDRDLLAAVTSWVENTPGNGLSAEMLDFVHRLDAAATQ